MTASNVNIKNMQLTAYITVGLPGCGKSTWAREHVEQNSNTVIVNNDTIRNDYMDREKIAKWTPQVEDYVRAQRELAISTAKHKQQNVIVDNTHLNPKTRIKTVELCEQLGFKVELVDFCHIPLDVCLERDSQREGKSRVGEKVIRDMFNKFMKEPVDRNLPAWKPNALPDCIIVDIDGTTAKMKDRGPFEEHKVYQDEVRLHVLHTIVALMIANPKLKVFFFSGRSTACLEETVRWLRDKCGLYVTNHPNYVFIDSDGCYYVELHMRTEGDRRRDSVVKRELYDNLIKDKYNVMAVFDDRPQVIRECWKELNLPVFNCGVIDVEF